MARQRKTDPEAALMAALILFWREGYANVGTRQIEEETGITRFTLQTTYGGKMALYLCALDAYLDLLDDQLAPKFIDGTLPPLEAWFADRLNPPMMPEMVPFGCLLVNATVEFHGSDPDIRERTERFYDLFRGNFEIALDKAVQAGNMPNGPDPRMGAELLLSAVISLAVQIRAAGRIDAGRSTVEATIAMIRSWGG